MYANYAYEIRTMPFQYHATFSHNFPHRPHDLYITFSHLDIIFFLSLPPLTTWLGCHFYGLDVTFSQILHGFDISFSHIPNDKMFLSTTDQMPLIFFFLPQTIGLNCNFLFILYFYHGLDSDQNKELPALVTDT